MSNPPEKIWAFHDGPMVGYFVGKDPGPGTYVAEYTRTDLHLALLAAAYLDAANLHQSLWRETSAYKTDQMLKRTPADAQASLEKVKREALQEGYEQAKADETAAIIAAKREAKNEALKKAAELVTREGFGAVHDKILALMEGAGDE